MKKIVIIGAGGLGREVLDLIQSINVSEPQLSILGFADDALPKGFLINGHQIMGTLAECMLLPNVNFVIAIGNPSIRKQIFEQLQNHNQRVLNLIHTTAQISAYAVIEPNAGVLILGHSFIGPNSKIGINSLVHTHSIIGHDTIVGNHSVVMQSCVLNGQITLEQAVLIGPSSVLNGKHLIKKSSVLAAGSRLT